jgi:putative iron-regulated protein
MRRAFLLLGIMLTIVCGVQAQDDLKQQIVENYADIVLANYQDSLTLTIELQTAVDVFIAEPSDMTLQTAKDAWLAAREPYGQTEAFRFYGGPIDDEDGPEGLINAWPMDEAYIDYVEGDAQSGIINNTTDYPDLNSDLLAELNEQGAEENIATGFHAIEFLLWGQDLSDDGAGNRPYSDYTTAPNAERRAQYLKLVTDLLAEHLTYLVSEWETDVTGNYRQTFLGLPSDEAITLMVIGVGSLSNSELPGERIYTAYDNQDQEDEHSCFSDNTHRDIVNNFLGIKNVYLGEYTRIDGTTITGVGLRDLLAQTDATLNDDIVALFGTIDEAIIAMHVPFDQAIIQEDYREQVLITADFIFDLGDKFGEVAGVLGYALGCPIDIGWAIMRCGMGANTSAKRKYSAFGG